MRQIYIWVLLFDSISVQNLYALECECCAKAGLEKWIKKMAFLAFCTRETNFSRWVQAICWLWSSTTMRNVVECARSWICCGKAICLILHMRKMSNIAPIPHSFISDPNDRIIILIWTIQRSDDAQRKCQKCNVNAHAKPRCVGRVLNSYGNFKLTLCSWSSSLPVMRQIFHSCRKKKPRMNELKALTRCVQAATVIKLWKLMIEIWRVDGYL